MKKLSLIFLAILVILFVGCSMDNAPSTGELVVQIGANSRELTSGELRIDMDVAYYQVTIGSNSSQKLVVGNYFRQQIEPGYYSVTVEAFNKDDLLIGIGSSEVNVLPGEVSTCTVEVKENAGNGRLIIHMDRDLSYQNNSFDKYYLFADIYSVGTDGADVLVDTIKQTRFSRTQNEVIWELPSGFYYICFYCSSNSENPEYKYYNDVQAFRIVNGADTVISCWEANRSFSFRPHIEFNVLTESPVMNGLFSVSYSLISDLIVGSVRIMKEPEDHSYYYGKIDEDKITVEHLRIPEGKQQFYIEISFDSNVPESYKYYLGEIDVQAGEQFYIETNSAEFITNRNTEFYLRCYPDINWNSTEWFYNGVNVTELNNWNNLSKDYCSINFNQAGENTVSAVITLEDGTKKTVSYSFEVKDFSDTLNNLNISYYRATNDGKLVFSVDSNFAGNLIAYPSDKNGNKIGEGVKVETDKWNSKKVSLVFPPDYQADDLYILLEGYKDGALVDTRKCSVRIYTNIIKMSLTESAFGVFTSNDKPCLVAHGLEHYNNYDFRIGYRLGAGEMHYVDGYDGPIEVIMPEDAIQSTYDLHWEIELYKNGWINGKSSGVLPFDYYPEGLPTIPSEKVYQAVVSKADLSGNLTFEYRILTLGTDSYYFFRAVATDNKDVYVKQYLESGMGKIASSGSTFTMNVKTSNGSRRAVECEMLENGNVRIDGIEYTSLNSIGIKQPGKSYEGAWSVPKINLGTKTLYSVFEKYVNSRPEVKQIFPGIDQLLSVRFAEGASADIGAYIKDGTIKFGISADIDFSLFDKALSLADKFSPYAELSLSFSEKSNDVLTINGEDYPARIMVSSDGTVLIIYVYRDGIIIPIAMSRASEYSNPSVSAENINTFNTDRYITLTEIAEFADKMNNENPDIYQSLIDSATTAITIGDDQVEFAGCWNVISDDISSLDGARIGVAAGRMLIKPSDTNVPINGDFSDADGIVTFDDGATMKINERRVSYGTLILRVDYSVNGITQSGELWLEKYSGNAFDLLVKYNELTGYSLNKIVFTTSGNIIADIIRDGSEETIAVGTYSLGDGDITIQVNPEKIHLPEELKRCELQAGVTLAYRDNEIILLEKNNDQMVNREFGIKLVDTF